MSLNFIISEEVIPDRSELLPDVTDGARVCFRGYVRQDNPAKNLKGVISINYACYKELAQNEGMRILETAQSRYKVHRILCIHRIGSVPLLEASLHIEAVSAHRREAFEAVEFIIDQIKESLPVWKKEMTATGEAVWT